MFDIQTDHQIVALGADLMHLLDNANGSTIVTAQRDGGTWVIHADAVETDATATTRPDAIQGVLDHALAALGGDGYSTMIPHGLTELP